MIFVTVGTDGPFDRMVRIVDRWAAARPESHAFAQIGRGGWQPHHLAWAEMLSPAEYRRHFDRASLIIAHAGMGTILTALNQGKPVVVMPKKASLGEHRNEHQTATARHLAALDLVAVAFDEDELLRHLDHRRELRTPERIDRYAEPRLIEELKAFIHHPEPH